MPLWRTIHGEIVRFPVAELGDRGYDRDMVGIAVISALEEAAIAITRLNTRVSMSPMREAWYVRSTILAAESLAEIDGMQTAQADLIGLVSGAPLPSPQAYAQAIVGFGHWRRCIGRVELSDCAARLVGRTIAGSAAAREAQEDMDYEDLLPLGVRRVLRQTEPGEAIDAHADRSAARALAVLRSDERGGPRLLALIESMRDAVRLDPDPGYFERIWMLRCDLESNVDRRAPASLRDAFKAGLNWDRKSHLGACFSVVPDRLIDLGLATERLSCLTGGTKRLGFDARLDDQAFVGVLHKLAAEAHRGMALLDALERFLAKAFLSPATKFDSRSQLPEVLYAILLLPAVDAGWIADALGIDLRVVQKLLKRFSEAGIVQPWEQRRASKLADGRASDRQLWMASGFEKSFERARAAHVMARAPSPRLEFSPGELMSRYRDVDVAKPMAEVLVDFDQEMIDLDRAFGHFWKPEVGKNRLRRSPAQRVSGA